MVSTPLLFDLAVLYRALSFGADGDLDPAEAHATREALRAWAPDEDPARVDHVMREAALAEVRGYALDAVVERVAADLQAVAQADGRGARRARARRRGAEDGPAECRGTPRGGCPVAAAPWRGARASLERSSYRTSDP